MPNIESRCNQLKLGHPPIQCEHIVASNGAGPIPTEMIHYYVKEASMFILALRVRDARIAPGAAAVLAKEPGQIRRTILRIATKIIDVVPAEIAEEQHAALSIAALVVLTVRPPAERRSRPRSFGKWSPRPKHRSRGG